VITAREIAAWRTVAPWATDMMVEQDYLLCRAVAAIFEDDFLSKQVAMRGGTVLHKGHLAPASRYSEDIDLVLVGDRPSSHIKKALTRVLRPVLGTPAESFLTDVRLAVRNLAMKSKILRSTYTYDPYSQDATLAHLKIEVNLNENRSLYPAVPVPILVPNENAEPRAVQVRSYDLDEMLGTKLRALLQREHGRDLFDLWWAWECSKHHSNVKVDPARVGSAFRYYMAQEGSRFSSSEFRKELDRRMRSTKFLKDMEGYLAIGQPYSPHDAYREFCAVFLPHLDA
jgi:predicted nucleotidyltransferase component of viral defense system